MLEWFNKLANISDPLRPPGAVNEEDFLQKCIRCRKCEEVCPYNSIAMVHADWGLKMGTPFIYPREMPCYLCENFPCIESCITGALEKVESRMDVKMGVAEIDKLSCFAYNDIVCQSCFERCLIYREAITMKNELYPVVDPDKCTGCGVCENVCPMEKQAIRVTSSHRVES